MTEAPKTDRYTRSGGAKGVIFGFVLLAAMAGGGIYFWNKAQTTPKPTAAEVLNLDEQQVRDRIAAEATGTTSATPPAN